MKNKKCLLCNFMKPLSEFHKMKREKDGHHYWCKDCRKLKFKEYYPKEKERIDKYQNEYRNANKEKILENKKEYYKKNRKEKLAKRQEYCLNNKEKVALIDKKSREKHKDRVKNTKKIYREKNREKIQAMYTQRRANLSFNFSHIEWLKKYQDNKCFYCEKDMERYTIDHIIPINSNGTNSFDNILLCCRSCNSSKQDTELLLWIEKKFGIERSKYIEQKLIILQNYKDKKA